MPHKLVVPAAHLTLMASVVVGVHAWVPHGLDQELAVLIGEQLIREVLEHWLSSNTTAPGAHPGTTHVPSVVSTRPKYGETQRACEAGWVWLRLARRRGCE